MRFDAVIFDIDNVLIDTTESYTDCIRKTVETYLENLGFRASRKSLLTRSDVETFKTLGGFNDDWDTCYGLLLYFLQIKTTKRTIKELAEKKDMTSLVRETKQKPLGVPGAKKKWGKKKEVVLKKIAEIFQPFYLNEFMWNEKLMIPAALLQRFKKSGLKMGIVTGRNREEALFALRRFQIDRYIDQMITTDETPEGKRKPDPWGLLKIADLFGENLKYVYVGDLPDDILTAKRAKEKINIASIGFLEASEFPEEMERNLKKAGANYICSKPKDLAGIILQAPR